MGRFTVALAVASVTLLVAGCGNGGREAPGNAAAATAAPTEARPVSSEPSAPPEAKAPAAGPTLILAGNGLEPGLTFGMPQAQAVAAATAAFGAPTGRDHNEECGEGPMDFVNFGDLSLSFQEGRLVGWSLSGPRPALRTARGLAIGAPRSALGDSAVERDTLGPEFSVDEVGGVLDEEERAIIALWAGYVCQFR